MNKVLEASIIDLGVYTADKDADGDLLNSGTNRRIIMGITSDNLLMISMRTNGGDCPLTDDAEVVRNWCLDMGDLPDDDDTRIYTGLGRLLMAIDAIENIYTGNDIILEQVAWYRGVAFDMSQSTKV